MYILILMIVLILIHMHIIDIHISIFTSQVLPSFATEVPEAWPEEPRAVVVHNATDDCFEQAGGLIV